MVIIKAVWDILSVGQIWSVPALIAPVARSRLGFKLRDA
jgi:hypothetical protein